MPKPQNMIDLISRQHAIDAINALVAGAGVTRPDDVVDVDAAIAAIRQLPKFVRKAGEWHFCWVENRRGVPVKKYWCNRCQGILYSHGMPSTFCPICGAHMKKEKVLDQYGFPGKIEKVTNV